MNFLISSGWSVIPPVSISDKEVFNFILMLEVVNSTKVGVSGLLGFSPEVNTIMFDFGLS